MWHTIRTYSNALHGIVFQIKLSAFSRRGPWVTLLTWENSPYTYFAKTMWLYNNVDQGGKRLSPFCELNGPYLFIKVCFVPRLVEISWNSPSGFGEENFQFFVNGFSEFPFNPLHPKPKNSLSQIWLRMPSGSGDFKKNIVNVFFLFCNVSSWRGYSFEQTWIPIIQGCFLTSLKFVHWF